MSCLPEGERGIAKKARCLTIDTTRTGVQCHQVLLFKTTHEGPDPRLIRESKMQPSKSQALQGRQPRITRAPSKSSLPDLGECSLRSSSSSSLDFTDISSLALTSTLSPQLAREHIRASPGLVQHRTCWRKDVPDTQNADCDEARLRKRRRVMWEMGIGEIRVTVLSNPTRTTNEAAEGWGTLQIWRCCAILLVVLALFKLCG